MLLQWQLVTFKNLTFVWKKKKTPLGWRLLLDFNLKVSFKTSLCRERRLKARAGKESEIHTNSSPCYLLIATSDLQHWPLLTIIIVLYPLVEELFSYCAGQLQCPASPCRSRTQHKMRNKQQQWQDKRAFDRGRLMVANREVSQCQPHACQTPKPHLSSVALSLWCRLLVKGTSTSVQQATRCGGEEVKTSFFITHFRKGERKIRKSRPQYSLD